jgi:hypothetical protein
VGNLYCGSTGCGGSGQPGFSSSPALWVKNMLDPNFVNSTGSSVGLMGRFVNAVSQSCVIGYALGGIPDVGTQTITVTTAIIAAANTQCNTNVTLPNGVSSLTITFTTTDASTLGTGTFDRKISMVSSDGNVNQVLWIKNDGTNIRIMTSESNTTQGYPYQNRYFADYNVSTQVARFEGVEGGFGDTNSPTQVGYYFYRIWTNQSSGEVRILGQNGGVQDTNGTRVLEAHTAVVGAGNYNQTDATIQIVATNDNSTFFDETGCVNMNTGVVDASTSGACSSWSVNYSPGSTSYNMVNTTALAYTASQWKRDGTIGTIQFDDSTIYTATPTN